MTASSHHLRIQMFRACLAAAALLFLAGIACGDPVTTAFADRLTAPAASAGLAD